LSGDFSAFHQGRDCGGHILEFELAKGLLEIDGCNRFLMILPQGRGDFRQVDLGLDRSGELEEAEK